MTIYDYVLTKIFISSHSVVVRNRGLVDGPVVERRIDNRVFSLDLSEVIAIDSINNKVSQLKILLAIIARVMGYGRLIDRPVVERWVHNWVRLFELHICLII